jgi:serine/threonine protein phosphatase PrpC
MGSFLDKPKTEKTNDQGQGNDLKYGLGAMQGWRIEMEDAHTSLIGLPFPGFENWSFFAVFDGHAGGTVSKYSATELIHSVLKADPELFNQLATLYSSSSPTATQNEQASTISTSCSNRSLSSLQQSSNDTSTNNTVSNNNNNNNNENITTSDTVSNDNKSDDNTIESNKNNSDSTTASTTSLEQIKSQENTSLLSASTLTTTTTTSTKPLVNLTEELENRLKKAIRQGFLDLDDKIRHLPEFERGEDKSGSTAVACLISPTHIYLINCGDSRALVSSENHVVLSTYDHKPINPTERERIHNAGGSVMIQRVNGSLAVSRALGDFDYKCVDGRGPCEQLVSPEPEIYSRERAYDRDEFVVLACDGIWDVMSNEDLKEFINSRLKVTNDLVKISNEVLDMCLSKVSKYFFFILLIILV